ncbi:MAG TPA: STAS domain-containing protein [Tepidisphaeraceae bacterium]|jgi:anti-anti-sigma factor
MITSDEYNGVCVITVEADLAGEQSAAVRKAVEKTIDDRHIVSFAIDLQRCPFIDSEGLETLLWVKRRCDELFGMMKVVNPDEHCRKIFEITRLSSRFDIEQDLTVALKGMR